MDNWLLTPSQPQRSCQGDCRQKQKLNVTPKIGINTKKGRLIRQIKNKKEQNLIFPFINFDWFVKTDIQTIQKETSWLSHIIFIRLQIKVP